MDRVNDDAKGVGYRRIELLTGPGRRRKWSDEDKASIIAKTTQTGAVVSVVARRNEVSRSVLWAWRKQVRSGALAPEPAPVFLPVQMAQELAPVASPRSEPANSQAFCPNAARVRRHCSSGRCGHRRGTC